VLQNTPLRQPEAIAAFASVVEHCRMSKQDSMGWKFCRSGVVCFEAIRNSGVWCCERMERPY